MKEQMVNIAAYPELLERLKDIGVQKEELTASELHRVIEKLNRLIDQRMQERGGKPTPGSGPMLQRLLSTAFAGILSTAQLIAQEGIGVLPGRDLNDQKAGRRFAFEVVLHLVTGLGVMKETFKEIAATCGADPEGQEIAAEALEVVALLLIIHAATEGNHSEGAKLLDSLQKPLEEGIGILEPFINELLVAETISGKTAEGLHVYLQQAKMALAERQFESVIKAYEGGLSLLGITPERLNKDCERLQAFGRAMHFACTEGLNDQTNTMTGIAQA